MCSCVFFGHRDYPYEHFEKQIKNSVVTLIENYGVREFYCGARGNFDWTCAKIVHEFKRQYPFIRCIRVWAYMPTENEAQEYFDGSVYLLEKRVPLLYAIVETNKRLLDKVEYILSGVMHAWGNAWAMVEQGKKKGRTIIYI